MKFVLDLLATIGSFLFLIGLLVILAFIKLTDLIFPPIEPWERPFK